MLVVTDAPIFRTPHLKVKNTVVVLDVLSMDKAFSVFSSWASGKACMLSSFQDLNQSP